LCAGDQYGKFDDIQRTVWMLTGQRNRPVSHADVPSLTVVPVESSEAMLALEDEWQDLHSKSPGRSICNDFDYIRIAWENFHERTDRLLVLTVRDGAELVAVAPFRLSRHKRWGIPIRVVSWIGSWEGDRPGMLCDVADTRQYWNRIGEFFVSRFTSWDLMLLSEQDRALAPENPLYRVSHVVSTIDSEGFFIPLSGTFESYIEALTTKVRSNWRNRRKKVFALEPRPSIERVDEADRMASAVDRFAAIEASGWKSGAGLGIGKDERHRRFYVDLTTQLARRGQASFLFLVSGGQDLAGMLLLCCGDVVYERHIAYNPEFSKLSPGIVLRAEILPQLFGSRFREFDLMGMHPSVGRQQHKRDWSRNERVTTCQEFFRRRGRLLPVVMSRSLRSRFQTPRAGSERIEAEPAEKTTRHPSSRPASS
jgi:hypothetical protein